MATKKYRNVFTQFRASGELVEKYNFWPGSGLES
jgi:hypothetical protein